MTMSGVDVPAEPAGSADPALPAKPKLRGWLHLGAAPLALAAGIVLIALADNGRARIASAVFAFSAVMFSTTAATGDTVARRSCGGWTTRTSS
jgi:hemolysin III